MGGAGGSGGGVSDEMAIFHVVPGRSYTVTIGGAGSNGTGGAAGANGTTGTSGGATSFIDSVDNTQGAYWAQGQPLLVVRVVGLGYLVGLVGRPDIPGCGGAAGSTGVSYGRRTAAPGVSSSGGGGGIDCTCGSPRTQRLVVFHQSRSSALRQPQLRVARQVLVAVAQQPRRWWWCWRQLWWWWLCNWLDNWYFNTYHFYRRAGLVEQGPITTPVQRLLHQALPPQLLTEALVVLVALVGGGGWRIRVAGGAGGAGALSPCVSGTTNYYVDDLIWDSGTNENYFRKLWVLDLSAEYCTRIYSCQGWCGGVAAAEPRSCQ